MYLDDLRNTTEIVLERRKNRRMRVAEAQPAGAATANSDGSAGRAAAAALRISNAVAAAVTDSRELEPVEARLLLIGGLLLLVAAALVAAFPAATGFFVAVVSGWLALSLLYRGFMLHRRR